MKLAIASSPRIGCHLGNDGGNFSVFDFDDNDPRPFRDKHSSKALFNKAFASKGNRSLKCPTTSDRRGKSTVGTKLRNRRTAGRKSIKKSSCQHRARNAGDVCPEVLSCSDKIETDDSDSVSEGDVSVQPALKKAGVVETSTSFKGPSDMVVIAEKDTEVKISGEALLLLDGICKCSPCFTLSVDAISLTVSCHSDDVSIKWPLKEIRSFSSSFFQESGFVVLRLGLGRPAAERFIKKLKQCLRSDEEGHVLVAAIRDMDWVERQRQITSLSDSYKSLWSPPKLERNAVQAPVCAEGFLRSLREENLCRVDDERNNTPTSREKDGFSSPAEEGRQSTRVQEYLDTVDEKEDHDGVTLATSQLQSVRHQALLHGWLDIVYPKGDRDAVTVTKNDFLLLSPEEFLSDTIIDFYIKHLQSTLSEQDRNRFYFFNSFFFRKLTEGETSVLYEREKQKYAFHRVKRWTARVNIFEKDYLFIPIMRSAHWSLIVVCHLGCVSAEVDEGNTCKAPVILHFDSLEGCHMGLEGPILNYLIEAWIQKYGHTGDHNSLCCKRLSEIKFMSAKVPQQTNYSDCGLFLLHYVELFIERARKESPSEFVTEQWFNPVEVSNKRAEIQSLIIRLHAMELANRYPSLVLPDNVALAVKSKHVSINDALAILHEFTLRYGDPLHSSKSSEVVQDGSGLPIRGTFHGLHAEKQFFMGIVDVHDHFEHYNRKGENKDSLHADLLMPAPVSELQDNLCSCQLEGMLRPSKNFLLCPSHAAKATDDFVGTSRKEGSSILLDQAFNINPISETFSVNPSKECMHACCISHSSDDLGQKIFVAPNNGISRCQASELQGCFKEISAVGIQSGSTNYDEINKSSVDSKQLDLALEYEMEDFEFSKFTKEKDMRHSGSISDTENKETHIFSTEKSMVADNKHAPRSLVMEDQHTVIDLKWSNQQPLRDEPPANGNSEDVSLQKKKKICEAIDSQGTISNHSNPCPSQEEHLWFENQNGTHETSLPCMNDASRVNNTQYISSDEEPSTPKYQAGLQNDVDKMLEAVNIRKRCKRKVAEDSETLHVQVRRPVTRSATKRKEVKSERATLLQPGRKTESPIEVK